MLIHTFIFLISNFAFWKKAILWLKGKKQVNKKFFFQQIILIFAVLLKN
jgi:hypothetical protein